MKVMFRRFTLLVLFALSSSSLFGQTTDDIENGHKVFDVWCLPCHAAGPKHPGTQALEILYKGAVPSVLQERTDLTVERITNIVRTGVSVMAPFRKTEISDDELKDLAIYLSTPKN